MSYKYKQRLEWTKSCKYATQYQYAIYNKLHNDVYNEYSKLFKKDNKKTFIPNQIDKKIYESRIDYSNGFLAGLKFIESMFDQILSMPKKELSMFKHSSFLNLFDISDDFTVIVNEHNKDYYKELKSETLLEINEHIIMEKKEAIERANKRFQENLDNDNEKEDETIVLNLTKEDINNAKNKGK